MGRVWFVFTGGENVTQVEYKAITFRKVLRICFLFCIEDEPVACVETIVASVNVL